MANITNKKDENKAEKAPRRLALGKGLGALFDGGGEVPITPASETSTSKYKGDHSVPATEDNENKVIYIGINDIKPNSDQPRKNFNEEKIQELSESIISHGIIQPLIVRPSKVGYEIVAGERRYRAARKAGLKQIPCIIRNFSDEENMLIAIIENMQREDLNPIEEAEGLNHMIKTYGMTQEEVSKSVGKSRPYITNALRLLGLDDDIKELVVQGLITSGHARALLSIKDEKKRRTAAKRIVDEGLSVREIEKIALGKGGGTRNKPLKKVKPRDIVSVEEELKTLFGTKVNIEGRGTKGVVEIEYYSIEELNRLIDILRTVKS